MGWIWILLPVVWINWTTKIRMLLLFCSETFINKKYNCFFVRNYNLHCVLYLRNWIFNNSKLVMALSSNKHCVDQVSWHALWEGFTSWLLVRIKSSRKLQKVSSTYFPKWTYQYTTKFFTCTNFSYYYFSKGMKKKPLSEKLSSQIRWTKNSILLKPVNRFGVQINWLAFRWYNIFMEKNLVNSERRNQ